MHSLRINYSLKPWHHQCWLRHRSVFCRSLAPPSGPPFNKRRPTPRRRTRPLADLWTTNLGPI